MKSFSTYSLDNIVITDDYFDRTGLSYNITCEPLNQHVPNYVANDYALKASVPVNCICFHGSPGTKEDFYPLEQSLGNYTFQSLPRKNYPDYCAEHFDSICLNSNSVIIGFSWGCRDALEFYAKNSQNIKRIILISPHIVNSTRPSHLQHFRFLFDASFKLLTWIDSRFRYSTKKNKKKNRANKHSYLKKVLLFLSSIREKTEHQVISYASILRLINELNTPVHLITGTSDHRTYTHQTLELIRAINPDTVTHFVNGGDYSLLHTHTSELTSIIKVINNESHLVNHCTGRTFLHPVTSYNTGM